MAQTQRQPVLREATSGTITVTQVRSSIANKPKTRGTMVALGLRKIGDFNVLPDRPEIRGMLARVPHLVKVTENSDESSNKKGS
ncbi:MAG: 50S ribosomal protein L30 [Ilumatobacteraceae bacterium]